MNSPSNPALKGSVAVLFVTGEGQTVPAGVNGKIARTPPFPKPLATVSVHIPPDAPSGSVPISFTVGNTTSVDMTTIEIR